MIGTHKQIREYLDSGKEDDIYECTRKTKKTLYSRAQQRYYFGVLIKISADFHGHTPVEQHELLKTRFQLETTTNLPMDEYAAMCNMIIDLYKEKFGVIIPLPKDSNEEKSLMDTLGF